MYALHGATVPLYAPDRNNPPTRVMDRCVKDRLFSEQLAVIKQQAAMNRRVAKAMHAADVPCWMKELAGGVSNLTAQMDKQHKALDKIRMDVLNRSARRVKYKSIRTLLYMQTAHTDK